MSDAAGIKATVKHGPPRRGDVRHSLADISAAKKAFGYRVSVSIENGLRDYIDWIKREEDRED
jgi:UDP-glucose 4-epimerase